MYLEKNKNNYLDAFIGLNNYNQKLILLGKIHINLSNTINLFEEKSFLLKKVICCFYMVPSKKW